MNNDLLRTLLRIAAAAPDAERFARVVSAAQRGKVVLDEQVQRGTHRGAPAWACVFGAAWGPCQANPGGFSIRWENLQDPLEFMVVRRVSSGPPRVYGCKKGFRWIFPSTSHTNICINKVNIYNS